MAAGVGAIADLLAPEGLFCKAGVIPGHIVVKGWG